MSDQIIVEYDANLALLQKKMAQLENALLDVEKDSKKAMGVLTTESNKSAKAVDGTSKQVVSLKDKLTDLANNLPFANQIKEVTALGSAVTGLGGAAQKSSIGFQVLRVAMLSTGIPILIAAIVSLIAYFKKTDEGGAKLAGVMSAIGAATDLVTGIVVGFGEAVFTSLTSVDNFKKGLSDLGDFLINNLVNRLKAPLVLFEALKLAIGRDFEGAAKKGADAFIQFTSGIENGTSKVGGFTEKALAAAQAAFEWEQRMDALEDKIREDSTVIAENDKAITKLIIQSKNKRLEDEKALALLGEASRLEEQNLAITQANERAKLKLIQERNKREADAINQDIKAGETRRSINDQLAQEERDQINKIIQLEQASANLQEKIQNRIDTKKEEIFQNNLKRLQLQETENENFAKAEFNQGITNAEQLEEAVYNIKLEGLRNQRQLLIDNGRDTIEIEKAIIDLQLANKLKGLKEEEALQKARDQETAKEVAEQLAIEKELRDKARKEEEDADKAHKAKLKVIAETSINLAADLAQGLFDANAQRRQIELQEEIDKGQKETDSRILALQKQKDQGLISQEEFDKQTAILQKKQQAREAKIKKDQFIADRNARLTNVAIDTAVAVVKAFAQLGPVAGIAGAALAVATGAVQAAIIAAQPIPKFAKGKIRIEGPGTGTSDSITAKLSRGESVMTAEETNLYESDLRAMREKRYEKHIHKNYVVPAMERMQRDAVSRREAQARTQADIAHSLMTGSAMDTTHMERILKANGNVNIKNASQLADEIAKRINTDSQYVK